MPTKHPSEMPDEILISLGFERVRNEYGNFCWKHKNTNKNIYHILTPECVSEELMRIGSEIARKKIVEFIQDSDFDNA